MTSLPNPWTAAERKALAKLRTPGHVQAFLDATAYSSEAIYRSPRSVLRDRKAHCFDGAMLAAAVLERLGFEPLLVDLRAVRDDDHVLAVYRREGAWGAVAKSNFEGLRCRDPDNRSLRELAMSYFEGYFNTERERTLRSVSRPVRLRSFERLEWRTEDDAMNAIADALDASPHAPLLTRSQVARLGLVDARTWEGHTVGTDFAGTWKPSKG
ncbi:MAG: hypothetical protein JNG84_11005 [Archangium sp.]|nr:hypothetical protein [Archangium sp.]